MRVINNPLTMIGIFAGLVEIVGAVALKISLPQHQLLLVLFIVLYPILLTILFFLVLIIKPEALYSPSEFRTDEAYIALLRNKVEELDTVKTYINSNTHINPQIKQDIISSLTKEEVTAKEKLKNLNPKLYTEATKILEETRNNRKKEIINGIQTYIENHPSAEGKEVVSSISNEYGVTQSTVHRIYRELIQR